MIDEKSDDEKNDLNKDTVENRDDQNDFDFKVAHNEDIFLNDSIEKNMGQKMHRL